MKLFFINRNSKYNFTDNVQILTGWPGKKENILTIDAMKIIQFTIPATKEKNIQVQEDDLPHFYEQLHHHYEIQVTCVIIPVGALVTYYHRQPFSAGDIFILGANQPVFFKTDASYFEGNSNKHIHTLDIFFTLTGFITSWPEFHEIRSIKKFMYLFLYRFQASGNKATLLEK